jgi:hypothetical protein
VHDRLVESCSFRGLVLLLTSLSFLSLFRLEVFRGEVYGIDSRYGQALESDGAGSAGS